MVFLLLPLLGLLVRAPWSQLVPALAEPEVGAALRLSLLSAALATLVSLLLGVPLVLATFFYVIWNKGFTDEDRTLFRSVKAAAPA